MTSLIRVPTDTIEEVKTSNTRIIMASTMMSRASHFGRRSPHSVRRVRQGHNLHRTGRISKIHETRAIKATHRVPAVCLRKTHLRVLVPLLAPGNQQPDVRAQRMIFGNHRHGITTIITVMTMRQMRQMRHIYRNVPIVPPTYRVVARTRRLMRTVHTVSSVTPMHPHVKGDRAVVLRRGNDVRNGRSASGPGC